MSMRRSGLTYNITRQTKKMYLRLREGIQRFYPQFGFRESDVLIASFPKSGRNWVRFLLANAVAKSGGREIDIHFRNSADWISTTTPEQPPVTEGYPRIAAEHGEYRGQDTQVIYILRHPADVMESYYVYLRDRWNEDVGEFSDFIRTDHWGVSAWRSHVESWEDEVDVLVTFEGLQTDTRHELEQMYTLFECKLTEDVAEYAVEESTFENMARMEEKYGIPDKFGANPEFTFMRSGESTQGEDYFDVADYRYLREAAGCVLDRYDYTLPIDEESRA